MTLERKASLAREASGALASLTPDERATAVAIMSEELLGKAEGILRANRLDVEDASRTTDRAAGAAGDPTRDPILKRLALSADRVSAMAAALREIADLPDVTGEVIDTFRRPNGLVIRKVRVPFGVVGVIYESRPNVTSDAAGLCVKSGNSVILRGGREASRTNLAIVGALRQGLRRAGVTPECVQFVDDPGRSEAARMMTMRGVIDLLVPRGGAALIRAVVDNATVPVIETGMGNCHVYVDKAADLGMAESIAVNAKCGNPAVCNAAEKMLVHKDIAATFLPGAVDRLRRMGVEVRGCSEVRRIVPRVTPATAEDWEKEYLDLIIAVKVVEGVDEAVSHINRFGTGHSEAIVTGDAAAAKAFTGAVDAAVVYVNASTRFTDGGEFGLGAEMGISTQKTHARGPLGMREMTTYKYVVEGSGQTR